MQKSHVLKHKYFLSMKLTLSSDYCIQVIVFHLWEVDFDPLVKALSLSAGLEVHDVQTNRLQYRGDCFSSVSRPSWPWFKYLFWFTSISILGGWIVKTISQSLRKIFLNYCSVKSFALYGLTSNLRIVHDFMTPGRNAYMPSI